MHRVKEIEEFSQVLNINQIRNWHTRMFLADVRTNLTKKEQTGTTGRYTKVELDELEKTLKKHEKWLSEWVDMQRNVPINHDPVMETQSTNRQVR